MGNAKAIFDLLDNRIGNNIDMHGNIGYFIRIIILIKRLFALAKAFEYLIMRFTYLGLFSVTHASMPDVSKIVMEPSARPSYWQIGSVNT